MQSLLNDASGIVLFELFHRQLRDLPSSGGGGASPLAVLPLLARETAALAAGGVCVGLAAGWLTRRLLRALRWHGASASQEVAASIAIAYLCFYAANAPLGVSGARRAVPCCRLLASAGCCPPHPRQR